MQNKLVRRLLFVFAVASGLFSATAFADVMPDCEEGQHLETNPVGPDETHHAGGQCVGDPAGCGVSRGRADRPAVVFGALAVLGLLVVRRRP